MHGFVIDPGAASNLCGTDTLLQHSAANLWPLGIHYEVEYSPNSFAGISGNGEQSAGRIDMPIGLEGVGLAYWSTDLIGGDGSACPALLANKSLVALQAASVTDVFDDHGGILALQSVPKRHFFFRIRLSDSGHYFLPFDKFDAKKCRHTERAEQSL